MKQTITEDSLDNLERYWKNAAPGLNWPHVFVLPVWLKTWWQVFGGDSESYIRTARRGDDIIGIAPLRKNDDTVSFIGGIDVCDYEDFIVKPGSESEFFGMLLDDLKKHKIRQLDLKHLRPESAAMTALVPIARDRGYKVDTTQEDVNVEMDLPPGWDAYLESLSSKQRHEVRRKIRRLNEAGNIQYRSVTDSAAIPAAMDTFFKMFVESRRDKADFLTEKRKEFFDLLMKNLAEEKLLKLGILELDGKPVAQIICFDYGDCLYLYNSGYAPEYVSLSAGLISKVLAIKDSIEQGKKKFDFLKGPETYKYHLGGKEVPLYRCLITIN